MPSLPLAARLPPELGLCFAPFSSARFALDRRGEPTFLDLQHNRTLGALLSFAQQAGVLNGPHSPGDTLDLPSAADFETVRAARARIGARAVRAPPERLRRVRPPPGGPRRRSARWWAARTR